VAQDLTAIEHLYDAVAGEYARAFTDEHARKPMDREVLNRFAHRVQGQAPVWDLGCGPGQTTRYLHDRGVAISGLDLSARLLDEARALHPGIHFQQGDLLALDFAADSVAAALAFYAIVHFSPAQVEQAFREVFRVLRPGGLFLLTFHVGQETIHVERFLDHRVAIDFMLFTPDFIADRLQRCGFAVLDSIEREPYPEAEYQSRRAYVSARKPRDVKLSAD
jgi:SAM-dependent methyltransferase